MLKRKKAMIESIKRELLQRICPQSALSKASSASNCRALCCMVAHEQAAIRNWGHSVVKLVIGRIQFLNTGQVATLGQNANTRAFCRWSRQETDLIGQLQQPETPWQSRFPGKWFCVTR
jgi:hypothetical protein